MLAQRHNISQCHMTATHFHHHHACRFVPTLQTFGSLKSSSKAKPESDDAAAAESEGEAAASSPEDEQQEADEQEKGSGKKRNRSRKPEKPSRAALDEASNGTSDDKPKGAKKRKPTSVRQVSDEALVPGVV